MPLLDHFRPPISQQHSWESFHSNWATRLADQLNKVLPEDFLAQEHTPASRVEIDLPSPPFEEAIEPDSPTATLRIIIPNRYEIRTFHTSGGTTLVGVIVLIAPTNKSRSERRAFITTVAAYLHRGISLILVDIVTSRDCNLHNETLDQFSSDASAGRFPETVGLYASAFRPDKRDGRAEVDLWLESLELGASLPTLPLRLTGDLFVPVDLEMSYSEACLRRRIVG